MAMSARVQDVEMFLRLDQFLAFQNPPDGLGLLDGRGWKDWRRSA